MTTRLIIYTRDHRGILRTTVFTRRTTVVVWDGTVGILLPASRRRCAIPCRIVPTHYDAVVGRDPAGSSGPSATMPNCRTQTIPELGISSSFLSVDMYRFLIRWRSCMSDSFFPRWEREQHRGRGGPQFGKPQPARKSSDTTDVHGNDPLAIPTTTIE